MLRRSVLKGMGAAAALVAAEGTPRRASAAEKVTIALIPGLTADGFYVTMHKGAEAAAKAVGAELIYQGAAEWNVALQVPIIDAIIARKPAAILIAPNDKNQLVQPLKKAYDAGIAVVCVDTFIGNGWALDTSSSAGGVTIMWVGDGWYRDHFVHGRRVLP